MAPRTSMGYPHKGPYVDAPPAASFFCQNLYTYCYDIHCAWVIGSLNSKPESDTAEDASVRPQCRCIFFFFFIALGPGFSDTKVYEP